MPSEHQLYREDGLDFDVLARGMWGQRYLVMIIAVLVFLVGAAYAFLSDPVYETKASIGRPWQADVVALNVGRGAADMPRLTPKVVNTAFVASLQSEESRRRFFTERYVPQLTKEQRQAGHEALWAAFGRQFVFSPGRGGSDEIVMAVQANQADLSKRWLADYLSVADEQAKQQLINDARSDISEKIDSLKRQIAQGRENARKEREDEISRLSEALKVARSVGINKPPIISSGLSTEVSSGMTGTLSYLRGVEAIDAQLANLRARTSDDPFVPGLHEMEASLSYYQGLSLEPESIKTYRVDGVIEEPLTPIKPRRGLILVMSLIGGLLIGLVVASLRVVARSSRPVVR